MSYADLLVVVPWIVFAVGVATLILMASHRNGRGGGGRLRRRPPRR